MVGELSQLTMLTRTPGRKIQNSDLTRQPNPCIASVKTISLFPRSRETRLLVWIARVVCSVSVNAIRVCFLANPLTRLTSGLRSVGVRHADETLRGQINRAALTY
jgi:hypothetical protein